MSEVMRTHYRREQLGAKHWDFRTIDATVNDRITPGMMITHLAYGGQGLVISMSTDDREMQVLWSPPPTVRLSHLARLMPDLHISDFFGKYPSQFDEHKFVEPSYVFKPYVPTMTHRALPVIIYPEDVK